MNVVVDGLMTSYQKTGNGKVILCLPGWGDTASTYSDLASGLKQNYKILILDLPGFGATQPPPSAWDLEDYIEFIRDFLNKIDEKKIYTVIAHSYGGSLAIRGLATGKLKADRLILLASAGVRRKQQLRKQLFKALAKTGKLPLKLLPASKQQRIRGRFYKAIGSDMLTLPHMEQTFKRIISQDVLADAANLKMPTLLVYGRADSSTPVSDGQILHRAIKGSKLEILEGGHFIHHDQAPTVNQLIREFL